MSQPYRLLMYILYKHILYLKINNVTCIAFLVSIPSSPTLVQLGHLSLSSPILSSLLEQVISQLRYLGSLDGRSDLSKV